MEPERRERGGLPLQRPRLNPLQPAALLNTPLHTTAFNLLAICSTDRNADLVTLKLRNICRKNVNVYIALKLLRHLETIIFSCKKVTK